jgi:hypothetical protein
VAEKPCHASAVPYPNERGSHALLTLQLLILSEDVIGEVKFENALLAAQTSGWNIVSMQHGWATIYPS